MHNINILHPVFSRFLPMQQEISEKILGKKGSSGECSFLVKSWLIIITYVLAFPTTVFINTHYLFDQGSFGLFSQDI